MRDVFADRITNEVVGAAKFRERGIDAIGIAGGIGTWRANGLPTEPLTEGDAP